MCWGSLTGTSEFKGIEIIEYVIRSWHLLTSSTFFHWCLTRNCEYVVALCSLTWLTFARDLWIPWNVWNSDFFDFFFFFADQRWYNFAWFDLTRDRNYARSWRLKEMKHKFWPEGAYRDQGGGGHNSWSISDTGSITEVYKGQCVLYPKGKEERKPSGRVSWALV